MQHALRIPQPRCPGPDTGEFVLQLLWPLRRHPPPGVLHSYRLFRSSAMPWPCAVFYFLLRLEPVSSRCRFCQPMPIPCRRCRFHCHLRANGWRFHSYRFASAREARKPPSASRHRRPEPLGCPSGIHSLGAYGRFATTPPRPVYRLLPWDVYSSSGGGEGPLVRSAFRHSLVLASKNSAPAFLPGCGCTSLFWSDDHGLDYPRSY